MTGKNKWINEGIVKSVLYGGEYEKDLLIEIEGFDSFRVFDPEYDDREKEVQINNKIKFNLMVWNLLSKVNEQKKSINFCKDRFNQTIIEKVVGKVIHLIPEKERAVVDVGFYVYSINRDKSIKIGDFVKVKPEGLPHIKIIE